MPEEYDDPFKFHSGLPEDFDGIIDDAYFQYDPEYNNGQTLLLKLDIKTEDIELQEMLKRPLQYSVGSGFEPIEGGVAIERNDGSKKGFHVNSAVANLLTAMLACDGAEKVLRGAGRGNPFRAELYIGTNWHWDRKTFKYGGDIGDKDRLMPTKFIGVKGVGGASGVTPAPVKGVTKKLPAKKAAAPVMAAPVDVLPDEPSSNGAVPQPGSEAWNNLWAIAMEAPDHTKFVEAAFELEGVADDENIQQFILDDGEGSMWAQAVAEYERINS